MADQGSSEATAPPSPPTPPPLPPSPPKRQNPPVSATERPCHFLEQLASAPPDFWDIPNTPPPPTEYKPAHYFFYGTLRNPDILKGVIDREDAPELRPAKIVGYELSSWGQYPALIDGPPVHVVEGFSALISSIEEEYKLAYYETNAYRLSPCLIQFTDGKEPTKAAGETFMYAGDAVALKRGKFDRLLWETQMMLRLPPAWDTIDKYRDESD